MKILLSVIAGIATAIPLVYALVKFVIFSCKERNWKPLLDLVIECMEDAEVMLSNGEDRKKWVVAMAAAAAKNIDYDIDEEELGCIIDRLCKMSKVVNSAEKKGD